MATTRTFTNGALGAKTRVLDSPKTSGKEVEAMPAGHSERINPRSLAAQGIARMPSVHLGPIATAMKQRGIQTERGDLNRYQDERSEEVRERIALEELDAGISRVKDRHEHGNAPKKKPPQKHTYVSTARSPCGSAKRKRRRLGSVVKLRSVL